MKRVTQSQIGAVCRRLRSARGCDHDNHDNRVNVAILDEGDPLPPPCPRCGEAPPVLVVEEVIVYPEGELSCAT